MTTRRQFLTTVLAAAVPMSGRSATAPTSRTILLRSSWQTANIGDIAHTPGLLRVIEQHLPDVGVILWPSRLDRGVDAMLRKRFPKLRIVRDAAWKLTDPRPDDPTTADAIREADLLVHGSGPSLVAAADLDRWRKATDKPYGVYGITIGSPVGSTGADGQIPDAQRRLLDGAAFLYTRETKSLAAVKKLGLKCPHVGFVPDATFALDVRDEAAADGLLKASGLEPGRFLCAVPRLRVTPYWEIYPERKMAAEEVARRKAVNERTAEADHAKLREAVVGWVRRTGQKVLVCPEMSYAVGVIKPLVYDPLPADVKPQVVPLDRYWLTDEAASVYARSRAVIGFECHSPIMANAVGRPGLYLRQPTDTWKGRMYPDLGLGAWKLEIEDVTGEQVAETLLRVHTEYDQSLATVAAAAKAAGERFAETMRVVRQALGAG